MPQQTRTYVPTRRYDLQLKIKDRDYTSDLYQVRLISSLNSPYEIFKINLFVDPDDIILEKIFGKDPIKLSIRLLSETQYPKEQLDFDLMYIKGGFQIDSKNTLSLKAGQKERSTFSITAVCRRSFQIITYPVNEVYENVTIKEVIQDLADYAGGTLKIDTKDINSEKFDQLIVPQTTLLKALHYLDKRFGIYSGAAVYFCDSNNTLFVKNITSKMKMNQSFTIYQLSTDIENTELMKKCSDGKNFYTYETIQTNYASNTKLSVSASTERYIATPRDQLFYLLAKDVKDVSQKHSLMYNRSNGTSKVESDEILESRERTFEDPCSYETNDIFAISKISKYFANLATVNVALERNLPILNLLNIGEAVKLNSQIIEFTYLTGKYVLKTCDLYFEKEKDWQTVCKLDLIRTNQII